MKSFGIGLLVIALAGACGEGRPDGTIVDGVVEITAEASVDGTPIGTAGITASLEIQVTGTMTDMFGIETSTYSWSGGPTLALPLDDAGAFALDLTLQAGDNELVLEGTSVVGEEVSTLVLTFTRDGEAPVIQLPDETFAAFITGEGEMDMEKQSTTFSLSGGVPLVVRDGITFSKFSSTWGPGQPNRLVWRFNLLDNHELTDARMDYRVYREAAGGTEDTVVDWTPAALGEASDFEVLIGSELNERFAQEDGDFVMELRAFDSAGLPSALAEVRWTQNLLPPPLFIATGSEAIMGIAGTATDPRSYVLDQNFSDIKEASTTLHVGSLLIGNPNGIAVLAKLDTETYEPLASYRYHRTYTSFLLDLPPAALLGHQCGSAPTEFGTGECYDFASEMGGDRVVSLREGEPGLTFDVYTSGGVFVSRGSTFVMAPNSEYFAIASPREAHSNAPSPLSDAVALGPFIDNVTYSTVDNFKLCAVFDFSSDGCARWDSARDYRALVQYYATWDFTARIQSNVDLDPQTATREFGQADPNLTTGYSRVLSTVTSEHSTPPLPLPTSNQSVSL